MSRQSHRHKDAWIGFAAAVLLTALPFGLVAIKALSPGLMLAVIGLAAIAQIVVHLRYFLGIGLHRGYAEQLVTLAFAAILLGIMVGGTLWIMSDLGQRMMY